MSARQRKQRNYAAMGYGSDDEYGYRCVTRAGGGVFSAFRGGVVHINGWVLQPTSFWTG